MDIKFLDILVCPLCKGKLTYHPNDKELICYTHRLAYPIREDIPVMLSQEARSLSDNEVKPTTKPV